MRIRICIAGAVYLAFSTIAAATPDRIIPQDRFAHEIGGKSVSFLATNLATNASCQLQDSDLQTRHAPWSTFKIPNFLIAMETGAVEATDQLRAWDATLRPAAPFWPDAWRKDQTLRTAFQVSAVWYFQDIALQVGTDRYQRILNDWHYGNATVPDGSDDFWLNNGLKISVQEQVDFLTALHLGELDISQNTIAALSDASRASSAADTTLHGKTGSGPVTPGDFTGAFEGWYVGWVARTDTPPAIFALHTTAPRYRDLQHFRKAFAITLLQECGFLPGP